jgi:hypothetical protein
MITKLYIRPVTGLLVRDEKTKQILPPEGKLVEQSTYWIRRLKCGDVVLVENVETEKETLGTKSESVKKSKSQKQGDE